VGRQISLEAERSEKMIGIGTRGALAFLGIASAGAALAWAGGDGVRLYLNNKVASSSVIMHNGATYVPVRDVAAALDLSVEKRPDGYALIRAGGANQLEGLRGKIGDDLFNGRYRFKVIKVVRGQKYTRQFGGTNDVEATAGSEIVAVICRLENGTNMAQTVDLMPGRNTAVTDQDSHSFVPFTGLANDVPERGPKLLPGAATDFAIVFQVPASAVLNDLVFSVQDFSAKPSQDFRVSVKE
jgi:hypothetical protein